jgi:hypothetical protein
MKILLTLLITNIEHKHLPGMFANNNLQLNILISGYKFDILTQTKPSSDEFLQTIFDLIHKQGLDLIGLKLLTHSFTIPPTPTHNTSILLPKQ